MDRLTLTFLNRYNACKEGITFVKNNNLLNFPFELLDQVKGDHNGYIKWLRSRIVTEYQYDERNNLVYYKTSNGIESWKEYDERNNLIHYKDSKGIEEWKSYDVNNNVVHIKNSNGYEYDNEIEYYTDGQLKKYNELELPYFEKVTT